MALILGIDPGTTHSALVYFEDGKVQAALFQPNEELLANIGTVGDELAFEMVGHFGTGMPVGKEVFWTVWWIGRFAERWTSFIPGRGIAAPRYYRRQTIKTHLCGSAKGRDGNVAQALLDRLGPKGTKKAPGPTYGVSGHMWQALAVAVCHSDGITTIKPAGLEG